jgi:hypothetical protein
MHFTAKDDKTSKGSVCSIAIPAGRAKPGNILSSLFTACIQPSTSNLSVGDEDGDDSADVSRREIGRQIARFQVALLESIKTHPDAPHATHIHSAFRTTIENDRKECGLKTSYSEQLAENAGGSEQYKESRIPQGSPGHCEGTGDISTVLGSDLNDKKKNLLNQAAGAAWDGMSSNGKTIVQPPTSCEYQALGKIRARRVSGPQGDAWSWVSVDP